MTLYLVTGAAGFIGSHLSEALVAQGDRVVGLDCFTSSYEREGKARNLRPLREHQCFELAEVDLRTDDLASVLDGVDVVLHLAGQPGARGSWGSHFSDYIAHNVTATHRLLEAAVMAGVGRLVYASSSSVYGNGSSFPTTEAVLPRPVSPYGITKLAAEHLCAVYAANWGLHTVALRYFTVYGPRQRPDMAFHRFIEATLRGLPIHVYGSGEQRGDFTHVEDVVRASLLATHRSVPPGSVINVAGGARATTNQVLENIGRIMDRRPDVQRTVQRRRELVGDIDAAIADCTLARLLLGWEPQVDLWAGLDSQVRWHLDSRPERAGARGRNSATGRG